VVSPDVLDLTGGLDWTLGGQLQRHDPEAGEQLEADRAGRVNAERVTQLEDRFKILDATAFWHEIVLKDYSEWNKDKANLRLGFHAAMALLHMADWTPEDKGTLADNYPCFRHLRSVAEASKHGKLTHPRHKNILSGAANIAVKSGVHSLPSLPFQAHTSENAGGSRNLGHDARIVVLGADGVERDFAEILQSVFEMWEKKVKEQGIE
jgi:hypothetical protein